MLLTAELLVFVIGPRECLDRVHGSERPSIAQRRSFANEFHLLLSPTWRREIGRVWILHRRFSAESTQITPFRPTDRHLSLKFPTTFANDCLRLFLPCAKQKHRMNFVFGGEQARLRSRAVMLGGLGP